MRFHLPSRRMFLAGAGGATLAIPFLPSLLPAGARRGAEAAAAKVPTRFVAIKAYNGAPVLDFYPRIAPAGYQTRPVDGTVMLSQALPVPTGRHSNGSEYFGHAAPLSDFASVGLGNVLGTSFDALRDYVTLFRGLDFMPNLNHNHGGFLGNLGMRTFGVGGALPGAQINVTIDQVMARSTAVYPGVPVGPRILHLGSRVDTCSYEPVDPTDVLRTGESAVQQAKAFVNPRTAFDAVFGTGTKPTDEPGLSASLVDRVLDDYRRARNGPLLSAADRQTLDRHLTYLTELEARLEGGGLLCDPSAPPDPLDTGGEFDVSVDQIGTLFEQLVDVLALAFACDATRIATLDVQKMVIADGSDVFGMGDSQNPGPAGRNNWHLQAHAWDANAIRWIGLGQRWIAQQVVLRLLERLHDLTETDGESMLHHSLVLWGNELSFNHLNYSMPTALFGRGGGRIRSGRYVDYVDWDRPIRFSQHDGQVVEGVQYNRLLVTLLQAMGLSRTEYELTPGSGFGESRPVDKGEGFALDYDASNVGEPLPDMLVPG